MSNDDTSLQDMARQLRALFIVNSERDLNFKFMHREKPYIYNNLSLKDKVLLRS